MNLCPACKCPTHSLLYMYTVWGLT